MKTIACLGSGSGQAGEPAYDAMVEVGRLLAQRDCVVVTGGFGGAGMEAPAKGAREAGGEVIGYTMFGGPSNDFLTREVNCRTQYVANPESLLAGVEPPPEIQHGIRLGNLMAADGFIVADGGGSGTFVEFTAYVNLMVKLWVAAPKKMAILTSGGRPGTVWVEILEKLEIWGMLPPGVLPYIFITRFPERAVGWVIV